MNNFQKLIIILAFLAIGIVGFYLYRQEQIRKEDVAVKEQQRKIADCKYLLNNKDLFSKDNVNLLENYQLASQGGREELAQKLWEQYEKQSDEYYNSESNCLDLLRRLGQTN